MANQAEKVMVCFELLSQHSPGGTILTKIKIQYLQNMKNNNILKSILFIVSWK
jgi:hypothetical protein